MGKSLAILAVVLFVGLLAFAFSYEKKGGIEAGARQGKSAAEHSKELPSSKKSTKKKASEDSVRYQAKITRLTNKRAGTEVERGNTKKHEIAFTFDAGSGAEPTPAILDALKKRGIKATFFLTGKWVEQNPKLTKRIVDEGHEIGNHTVDHPDLTHLSPEEVVAELVTAAKTIKKATGRDPKPFFRAPFGARTDRELNIIRQQGYFSVYWTMDSFDWQTGVSEAEVRDRELSAVSPGAIILSHCGSAVEARVLPGVLDEVRKRGYRVVRLSDIFVD